MAEVFLGHQLRLGRPVAIKILHARVREDPNLLKMLESEAAALTSMQHPNIVRCIDCNVVDGRPYIVMELLDGITLHDRLENLSRDGLLPPLHVVERLIRSTADALDHAHARGVVHRDLKPANIMLLSMAGRWPPCSTSTPFSLPPEWPISQTHSNKCWFGPWPRIRPCATPARGTSQQICAGRSQFKGTAAARTPRYRPPRRGGTRLPR